MYEDCGICNAKVKQNDTSVICSGLCGKPYHNRCINLTAKDCQFILSLNNLKWFCENCLLSFNNYFEMNKKVEDLKKTMNVEMNKIYTAIKGSQLDQKSAQKTFAEVAGNTVIIKPKNKQDTRATRDDIIKKLNPTELELGITGVRNMREGGLAITCQTDEDTTKIRKEVTRKLKNYSVVTREPKKPCIKIVDIADDLNTRTCIVKQNGSILHHETDFRIKTIKKMKKTYMAIVECDPITFKKITDVGRLTIGWSVCRIYEHVGVFRCFQCGGFNHKAADCQVEHWLKDSEILNTVLDKYSLCSNFTRKDSKGGGVSIYVRSKCDYKVARITANTAAGIDYLCSHIDSERLVSFWVSHNGLSDYSAQILQYTIDSRVKNDDYYFTRVFNTVNSNHFLFYLAKENWMDIMMAESVDDAFRVFISILQYYIELCFPMKRFKISHKSKSRSWLTKGIRISSANLRSLYEVAINSRDDSDWQYYKDYKRIVKHNDELLEDPQKISDAFGEHYSNFSLNNKTTNSSNYNSTFYTKGKHYPTMYVTPVTELARYPTTLTSQHPTTRTASAGEISNDIDESASNDEVDMVSNIVDKNTSDVLWDVLPTNNVVTQSNKISKIKCCTDTTFKGRETTSCKVTLDPPVEVNNSNLYLIVPRNNLLINKSLDIMDNFTEIQNKTVNIHNFSNIPQKLFENTVIGYLKICESNEGYDNEGLDEDVDCFVTTIGERNVSINESLEYQQKHQLLNLLGANSDIMAWDNKTLGKTNLAEHEIDTGNALPIRSKPYRVSKKEREIIQEQF
ncbi:hypothetical protein QE152_g30328 [Popillia japonica]|uniref:PHD-type domain-containing protein n=1 Tax=Popillia japonica TaxID=7064 RepID=A0AAW1JE86_POPJA